LILALVISTSISVEAWVAPGETFGMDANGLPAVPISPAEFNPFVTQSILHQLSVGAWITTSLGLVDYVNGSIFPNLADSWSYNPNNLTLIIHIRPGLTWFNGKYTIPLTAKDVWADLLIKNYAFQWWYIYISRIYLLPGNSVMIVYSRPWYVGVYYILGTGPYLPYFMVSNFTQVINSTLWKYNWNISAKQIKNLTSLASAVEDLKPSVDWSDGPYWLDPSSITNVGVVIYKNPFFWKAYAVKYPAVNAVVETNNRETALNYIEQGIMAWAWPGLPSSMFQALNQTGKVLNIFIPGNVGFGVYLRYVKPFDNPLVRQAFMYLVNGTEVGLTYAPLYPPLQYAGNPIPTGLPPFLYYQLPSWVKPLLRNYTYNVSEGFKLLQEAGWKYVNGQWYFPNGSPADLIIDAPAPYTNQVADGEDVALQLSHEGISSKLVGLDVVEYTGTVMPQGLFTAGTWFYGGGQYLLQFAASAISFYYTYGGYVPEWGTSFNTTWDVPLINGTTLHVNLTQIYINLQVLPPFSKDWNTSLGEFVLWYNYWLPVLPYAWKFFNFDIYTPVLNMTAFWRIVGQPSGLDYGYPKFTSIYQISIINYWAWQIWYWGNWGPANPQALQSIQYPYPPNVTALLTSASVSTSTTTTTTTTSVTTTTTTTTTATAVSTVTSTTVVGSTNYTLYIAIAVVVIIVAAVVIFFLSRRR